MKTFTFIFGVLTLLCYPGNPLYAAASGGHDDAAEIRQIVRLPFREYGGLALYKNVPLDGKDIVFRKEPDYNGHEIVRGDLPIGHDKKDHLCFAWDSTERKLYLDVNRNLDLTDDPSGVYYSYNKNKFFDFFKGIRIVSYPGHNPAQYLLDIRLQRNNVKEFCNVMVCSGWQGAVKLYGRTWWIGIVDNLDGIIDSEDSIIVQPVAKVGKKIPAGFLDFDRIPVPDNLFFGGHTYKLSFTIESGEAGGDVAVSFTETHPHMGELTIDGSHIKRLYLAQSSGENLTFAMFDSPGKTVHIPAGTYDQQRIILAGEDSLGVFYAIRNRDIIVSAEKPATVRLGAPLNNSVSVKRRGSDLLINYQLLGAEGEVYTQAMRNTDNPPQFAAFLGGRKIASGSFRYG